MLKIAHLGTPQILKYLCLCSGTYCIGAHFRTIGAPKILSRSAYSANWGETTSVIRPATTKQLVKHDFSLALQQPLVKVQCTHPNKMQQAYNGQRVFLVLITIPIDSRTENVAQNG